MYLTSRQKKILLYLNKFSNPVTGKTIAKYLNVSVRTIQTEIKVINKTYGFKVIESSNKGYTLNRNKVKNTVFLIPNEDDFTSILKLLILEDISNLDDLADKLFLSPSALQQRLKKIDAKLKKYNLNILRQDNHVKINGSEYHKRQLIHDMIMRETKLNFNNIESASNYFININIQRIQDIIMTAIRRHGYYVESCYAPSLIINILIALSRIRENYFIESQSIDATPNTTEYQIAKEICEQLGNHWYISITENDVQYISMIIMGRVKADTSNLTHDNTEANQSVEILKIIKNTFNYYMLSVDYNDSFLTKFIEHINALIVRARSNQCAINLISENLKEMSPFVYDVAIHLAKSLEEYFDIKITDEEIGLLSVYIGFVIEQSTASNHLVNILLACDEYHHIADYILSKLKSNYKNQIRIINVVNNLTPTMDLQNVDLIIHTTSINVLGKKSVLISPFYTEEDSLNIDNAINAVLIKKRKKRNQDLLLTYFDEKLYFKNKGIKNKVNAIKFLGNHLEKMNICEKGFTESVLRREAISSTCFLGTFAVPHAIELNAKFTQFCVLIEEDGIKWDDNNINCVFMIAVSKDDRKAFMEIYSGIVQILCDKESIDKLIKAPDFSSFINHFNR